MKGLFLVCFGAMFVLAVDPTFAADKNEAEMYPDSVEDGQKPPSQASPTPTPTPSGDQISQPVQGGFPGSGPQIGEDGVQPSQLLVSVRGAPDGKCASNPNNQ